MLAITSQFLLTVVETYGHCRAYDAAYLDIKNFLEVFPEMEEQMLDRIDPAMIACIHGTQYYRELVRSRAADNDVTKMWEKAWAAKWSEYRLLHHLQKRLDSRVLGDEN